MNIQHLSQSDNRFCFCVQRVLSRQEELKERARLLLEQARRDAAIKAGSKNAPATTARSSSVSDVSDTCQYLLLQSSDTIFKEGQVFGYLEI